MNTSIIVTVNKEQFDNLYKVVKGNGGYQGVLRAIQNSDYESNFDNTYKFFISPETASKVIRASKSTATGGFQRRIAPFVAGLKTVRKALLATNGRPKAK